MTPAFSADYARLYDSFYAGKDYFAECDVLERAFAEFSPIPVHRILDVGCGTGGHAIPLALRGYELAALDRSPAMLHIGRDKAKRAGVAQAVRFIEGDIARDAPGGSHDAVLSMFNVLGYLDSDAALGSALRNIRDSLREGGLLIFDAWHARGVHARAPSTRLGSAVLEGIEWARSSSAVVEPRTLSCLVKIDLAQTGADNADGTISEEHRLRYFDESILGERLRSAGLELLRVGAFPKYWLHASDDAWSFMAIARAAKPRSARRRA